MTSQKEGANEDPHPPAPTLGPPVTHRPPRLVPPLPHHRSPHLHYRQGHRPPAGTSTHGALHLLLRLESLGLATRVGQGRGTRWLRGPRSLTAAAESCGALAHQQDLHETVTAERAAWHAPTVRSSRTIRERLRLRRRRRDSRPPDKESHAELPFGSTFAKPMSRSTSARYRRARGSSVGRTGGGEGGKSP